SSEGLGLSLIKNLISDLGGRFALWRDGSGHTVAEVRFPLARNRSQVPGGHGVVQGLPAPE
ncbi:MAG TPA: ATP-binding protein, partial [Ktedonobacteraceae bacterium]|nr:ATP-binding protein [Ktedonobacteraceae bacterium]